MFQEKLIQVGSLPVVIEPHMYQGKPCIKFLPLETILQGAIIDQADKEQFPDGISAIFDKDGFTLWEKADVSADYQYHAPYPYKDMPVLFAWLKQQNMLMPVGV